MSFGYSQNPQPSSTGGGTTQQNRFHYGSQQTSVPANPNQFGYGKRVDEQPRQGTPRPAYGYGGSTAENVQRQKKEWVGISRIIARINGRDRVMDLRDGLSAAPVEEYATLHRKKSKRINGEVQYASMIPITICDYSVKPSVTVQANMAPHICEELYEAAKGFIFSPIGFYEHHQERLNIHEQIAGGRCPYTQLRITYDQKIGQDGRLVSNYPWNIQITKTTAIPQTRNNGGISAVSGSIDKSAKPVFIRVNNSDFFGMMFSVHEYMRLWGDIHGKNLILEAEQQMRNQKQAY